MEMIFLKSTFLFVQLFYILFLSFILFYFSQQIEDMTKILQEKDEKINNLEAEIRTLKKQMKSRGTEISELQKTNTIKKEDHLREIKEKDAKFLEETQRYLEMQENLKEQLLELQAKLDGVSFTLVMLLNQISSIRFLSQERYLFFLSLANHIALDY